VLFDPRTRTIENLTDPVNEPATNRLNDGKVGPDGCFWVGSMDENTPRQKTGALYRVTPTGGIERKAEGYAVSNGLAWSPDGRVMYHSDSTAGIIEAWDFDARTGGLANHRVLATRPGERRPTAPRWTWKDLLVGGTVRRMPTFSPSGTLLSKLPFPVPGPTMPCFAGRHLYVTSLREAALERWIGIPRWVAVPRRGAGAWRSVGLFADA
jgi:sugar lactone lactonase YvrE